MVRERLGRLPPVEADKHEVLGRADHLLAAELVLVVLEAPRAPGELDEQQDAPAGESREVTRVFEEDVPNQAVLVGGAVLVRVVRERIEVGQRRFEVGSTRIQRERTQLDHRRSVEVARAEPPRTRREQEHGCGEPRATHHRLRRSRGFAQREILERRTRQRCVVGRRTVHQRKRVEHLDALRVRHGSRRGTPRPRRHRDARRRSRACAPSRDGSSRAPFAVPSDQVAELLAQAAHGARQSKLDGLRRDVKLARDLFHREPLVAEEHERIAPRVR